MYLVVYFRLLSSCIMWMFSLILWCEHKHMMEHTVCHHSFCDLFILELKRAESLLFIPFRCLIRKWLFSLNSWIFVWIWMIIPYSLIIWGFGECCFFFFPKRSLCSTGHRSEKKIWSYFSTNFSSLQALFISWDIQICRKKIAIWPWTRGFLF